MLGWVIVVGLQAVAGPPALDLKAFRAPRPCRPPAPGEDIVVCARTGDEFRLKPLPPKTSEAALPKAEVGVGSAKVSAETEQGSVGGFPSNRAMIRLKMPF